MIIDTYPWGLRGSAPAKLNLTLEVLSKRNDGYHDIESLMVPVSLWDTIFFRPNRTGKIDFTYAIGDDRRGKVATDLPLGSQNLVVKAIEAVRSCTDSEHGAVVHLVKRIPTESGMGGGSSDAACALVMANRAWQVGLPLDALMRSAAQLGSDVPFFLAGGPAICRGRGEQVEPVRVPAGLPIVVVRPPLGLSTAEIYKHVKVRPSRETSSNLVNELNRGARGAVQGRICNDLQEAASEQLAWIDDIGRTMSQQGCRIHQMTGSGSAYFGVCHHVRHRQMVANRLRCRGEEQVMELQTCRH